MPVDECPMDCERRRSRRSYLVVWRIDGRVRGRYPEKLRRRGLICLEEKTLVDRLLNGRRWAIKFLWMWCGRFPTKQRQKAVFIHFIDLMLTYIPLLVDICIVLECTAVDSKSGKEILLSTVGISKSLSKESYTGQLEFTKSTGIRKPLCRPGRLIFQIESSII